MRRPEILAPAGDFVCLQAALDAGADAVYFGLGTFNMRARSGVNFKEEDLPEISRRCKEHGAKAYLALNAIMFEGEMADVEKVILAAKAYVDAVIVADWGVVGLCIKHSIPFHVSTQMSTSNSQAALFLASQGAERVVLARECSLSEVKKIHSVLEGKIELECFVHGAQCVAESGRCFMSHDIFGKSANRGECHQPCRRRFLVKAVDLYEDELGNPVHDSDTAFEVGPHTVMSAKDLCSLSFVDKLMDAGIASFKIEGRARNAEYVKTVTAAYREAVDAVIEGRYTPELIASLEESVDRVFHREFSKGLYFGRPGEDQFTDCQSSRSSYIKRHVGIVEDYFVKAGIVQVTIQDHSITEGDLIQIHGPTTGVVELTVPELRRDDERPTVAERGTWITFAAPRCRVGDKVFFMGKRNTLKSLAVALLSFILPISLLASIAVNIDTPIKDQRDSRAGTGVGYSGSMGQERHCFTKQFFVNEPDKSWEILRAGGYWFDRSYNTSQHWQRSIRLDYVKDPVERAKLEKKVVHPRYFYDWCKKHGVRSLNVLECTSSITNYVTGATSSALNDIKKGILDYVKWIVDNGYKDQIVGFELGNEPYFGSNPEESAARWSVIVPEIKKIFPEVDIGISVAEYREGDPDIAAVRRRSTAVDKWFEGGDYYGFNRVNQWSGRFIVSSSNFMHHISHVIYHFYGGNTADGLGPCGYRRIRHFAKAFPEVANKRVWVTEWRERSDEDCRCHQMFSSTLTKAHYILSSTAAKMFDCSSLHTASSLSGGFAITSGDGVWHVQWDPAGRNFSDPDFTGKPRMEVGPAGPLFRLYNEALQGHPLICAFGGRDGIRNPEEDWTGVMFYNNTKKYEAWHGRNEEGPPPKSGGGPTWVAAASPDRTSLNLLVCNSSDEPWTQEFVFPGYKIVGAKKVRAYSCKAEYVQRHMIPGEKSLAWEEEYEVTDKSIKIKPYTIATINFKIKKAKAVVGLLSDTFITASTSSCVRLEKAMKHFRDSAATTILHAGGIIDRENGGDFSHYAALRSSVFTNSLPKEVFSFALSDASGKSGAEMDKAWNEASKTLGAKHALYDVMDIGGAALVVVPENPDKQKYEDIISKAAKKAAGDVVIVLQRRPAEGTSVKSSMAGAFDTFADGSSSRALLDKYPNLLVLSGHVCSNPYDERSIWQGPFSAVAIGGLGEYAETYTGNPQNIATNDIVMTMSVFDDEIVFSRYDSATGAFFPIEWAIARKYNPANAVYTKENLSSRSTTGYFSSKCDDVAVSRDATDGFVVSFQEACSKLNYSQTWRYRVELFDDNVDSSKPFARQDVRGSWDLPGRYTDWHKKTRPKSARFSASLLSGVSSIRVVVSPESFAGTLGNPIKFENSVPSPEKNWKSVGSYAVKVEQSKDGTWRTCLDKAAFAGNVGDMFAVAFSYVADADARLDLDVGGTAVPKQGFYAVGLGEGAPLKYAFEFTKGDSDDVAIVVGKTLAKRVSISNLSVFRLSK